jgi:hypothetical protein
MFYILRKYNIFIINGFYFNGRIKIISLKITMLYIEIYYYFNILYNVMFIDESS